jgi:osmotically-inducible protein OsmY
MKTESRSDIDLRERVEEELGWEPGVDARRIGVAVLDGIVTLTGEVSTYTERWRAERTVERVEGVRGIANEIEVKLEDEHSDTDIAKRAADKLKWNLLVPDDKVTVKVDKGWITLKGDVKHDYQRRAAQKAVRDIPGVRGVTNLIAVKPDDVEPDEIKDQIQRTFSRQAVLDANNIHVEVRDGEVTLTGTVRSWAERVEAERVAVSQPGVKSVRNRIEVRPPI